MSDASIFIISLAFVFVDLTILLFYIRAKALYGGHPSYYGPRLQIHLYSSLLCVITGAIAIFSYPSPIIAVLHGILAMVACGPSAVALAPYTAGHPGFMLCGYTCAGAAWMAAGFVLCCDWGQRLEPLFHCFVISHTFAFVRTVFCVQWILGLPAEKDKTAYDVAAFTAFLATSVIAWGRRGALIWCGVLVASLGSQLVGLGDRWHVSGAARVNKRGRVQVERPKGTEQRYSQKSGSSDQNICG